MILRIATIFLLLASASVQGRQSALLDSIWKVSEKMSPDSARLAFLHAELVKHARNDAKGSIVLAQRGVELAKKSRLPKLQIEFDNVAAVAYYFMGNYDTASMLFDAMLDSSGQQKPLPEALAYGFKGKGIIYYARGDYSKALDFYIKALNIQLQLGNESELAKLYNNIGLIYTNQQVYGKARESFESAIALYQKLGDKRNEGGSLNNIGNAYYREKKLDEAFPYFDKSLKMRQELKDVPGEALGFFNIGSIYFEKGDYVRAEEFLSKSNALREQLNDLRGLALGYRRYGEVMLKLNKKAKAKAYIAKGLELANKIKAKLSIQESYALLAQLYKDEGDYAKAYQYLEMSAALKDSIYNENSGKEIARLQTIFESDKKERDIKLLMQEREIQELEITRQQKEQVFTYAILGMVAVLLVGAVIGFTQKQKANAQLTQQSKEILAKNEEITLKNTEINQQNDEISAQNELLNTQKHHLEKAYEQIKTLSDIGQKITASLNATSIVYTVYEQLNNLMPAECFGIGLLDERAKEIYYPVFIENGEGLPPHRESLKDPRYLSGKCLKEGKPLIINNLYEEYEKITGVALQAEVGSVPHAVAFFPLMLEDKPIGVLTAQSFKENAYQEAEINILRSLASYTAIAMDNADAYEQIEQKNKHITDSIRYAQTIQQAMLPAGHELTAAFQEHFVFFKPKDIVSGDFYWMMKADEYTFVAVADCTGHGVPGAFMSMICQSLLNEAVSEKHLTSPEQILFWLNHALMVALRQDQKANNDGMDIALCRVKQGKNSSEVVFAGAKRPLYYWSENALHSLKGSRFSIGGRELEQASDYAEEAIALPKGACVYLCSDGLTDQNNAQGRKFGTPRLLEMLSEFQGMDMGRQQASIEAQFAEFIGSTPQRDDISMLGFRV